MRGFFRISTWWTDCGRTVVPALRVLLFIPAAVACAAGGTCLAEEDRTPRAGEAYSGTVFGRLISAPALDRRVVTDVNLSIDVIPDALEKRRFVPTGGVLLWRNRGEEHGRLRAVLSGLYDDVRWDAAPAGRRGLALTFFNETLPWDRSEYVQAVRVSGADLQRYQVRAGAGVGWRRAIAPGNQDNAVEIGLTLEPGALFFSSGTRTSPDFQIPRDVFEGRIHLRFRLDGLERNILELPHAGWAAGLDGVAGQRAGWRSWGGGVFGVQSGAAGRRWDRIEGWGLAAFGTPGASRERHRWIASAYAGIGSHLDRFSAFRLGGGSNAGDWESLSTPIIPAAAYEELFPSRYGLVNLEYRYQALFFLYLQLKGTLAWVEQPRFTPDRTGVSSRMRPLHGITAGVTSGFLWSSEIEVNGAYNFGLERQKDGRPRKGGRSFLVSWTKTL
ncbi:MAG: hypothetical protein M3R34_08205 [Acidobacteriota bacterium]|nr:hypothetical protein [Acidobacteriota bacterium]